jgi:sporulation protein YlmC with PRC-barrel domain
MLKLYIFLLVSVFSILPATNIWAQTDQSNNASTQQSMPQSAASSPQQMPATGAKSDGQVVEQFGSEQTSQAGGQNQARVPVKIRDFWNKNIYNRNGDKLGTVNDLVTDQYGRISYIILSHGGLLGIGDKLIPIPMRAVKHGNDNRLVINMDKESLEKAPNFEGAKWPNFAEPEWTKKTMTYWQIDPNYANK